MQSTPDEMKAALLDYFGRGYQRVLADLFGMSAWSLTKMSPQTIRTCSIMLDLLRLIPLENWPADLRALATLRAKRLVAKMEAADADA